MKIEGVLDLLSSSLVAHEPLLLAVGCPDFSVERLIEGGARRGFAVVPSRDGPVSLVAETGDLRDQSRQTGAFGWHKDGLYYQRLPQFVILFCVDPGRGDSHTSVADCGTAWKGLDSRLQNEWGGLELVYESREGKHFPRPLVERHSRTGKPMLNVSQRATVRPFGIENSRVSTGASVLAQVEQKLDAVLVHEQRWACGSLLLFDNERFAHARVAASPDADRRLIRIWLSRRGVE